MTTWRVPLSDLDYGPEEQAAVLEVLNSRWLTMGEVTRVFEDQFAHQVDAAHAVSTTNATAALHLACLACGIGPGDEVIVPSLSFVATANAVLYTGASVRFADILSPDELTISPESIEASLTPRTKAVIVMHYAGYPCRMYDILEIASQHNLCVIEDAAHAPGASLDGRPLGTWGDAGCFSFFSNKNLATGEGGMLVTNNPRVADRVRVLRSHGMTSLTWDRHQGHAFSYDVTALGYNYRIDEIRAALGLVQLRKLNQNNARRTQVTRQYWHAFRGTTLLLPFEHITWSEAAAPACHIFPILLPENIHRETFIKSMHAAGVQTSIHYPPIHTFSYYRDLLPGITLPVTEHAASRQVTLPLYPGMSQAQVDLVIDAVRASLGVPREEASTS